MDPFALKRTSSAEINLGSLSEFDLGEALGSKSGRGIGLNCKELDQLYQS